MFPLIDAPGLAAELATKSPVKQGDLRLIDVRWYLGKKSGKSEFDAGHLPRAVFVDLDTALANAPASVPSGGPGRHPLPSQNAFEQAMRGAGVNDDTRVVAYDDAGGSIAARLWWLLRYFGHANAAVLDGGIDAWKKSGGELSTLAPEIRPGNFRAKDPRRNAVVDRDGVSRALANGALVLDARANERYRGDTEPIDARAGHIPGAKNAPWSENISDGKFLTAGDLEKKYRALGAAPDRELIVYCGSGVTACHDLLALELAGISGAKLYEGSWSDWAAHEDRPIATGDT
jgi:thiosulfate/3-mercaptopyruvate sulfurtransferase